MDEMVARRQMAQGRAAEAAIDAQEDIWQDIEEELWKLFKDSKADDKDGREKIYSELHALKALKVRYERIATQGKKAEHELEQQRTENEQRNRT